MKLNEKSEILITLFVSMLWVLYSITFLTRSLSIDETITYWVSSGSAWEAISRSLNYQGQSPLFFLLQNVLLLINESEIAMRIPSFIFALLSSVYLFQIGKRLFDTSTATFALVFLFSSHPFISAATTARPYSLGLLAAIFSTYSILQWIDTGKSKNLFFYIAATTVTILCHYFFSSIIIVNVIICYLLIEHKQSARNLILAHSVLVAPLLLGYLQLHALNQNSSLHYDPVSLTQIFLSIITPNLFMLTMLFCYMRKENLRIFFIRGQKKLSRSHMSILFWYFVPVIALYVLGLILNKHLYQTRYVLITVPAYALLCGRLICVAFTSPQRIAVLLLTTIVSIVLTQTRTVVVDENWREIAAELIKLQNNENKTSLVLVHSTLMESVDSSWISTKEKKDYLLAPFSYYKVPQSKLPLPYHLGISERNPYLSSIVPMLNSNQQIYVVTRAGEDGLIYLNNWFSKNNFPITPLLHSESVSLGRVSYKN